MTELQKTLQRIMEVREQKRYTQAQMADVLEVSLRTYQKMENGKAPLGVDQLYKIAAFLNKKPSYFLGEEGFNVQNHNSPFSIILNDNTNGTVIYHPTHQTIKELLEKMHHL